MKYWNFSVHLPLVFLLGMMGLISACVHQEVASKAWIQLPERVFPDGQYQQEVKVEVTATKPAKKFDFNCLVKNIPNDILLVGYNSFGFSIFKIREQQGKPLESETSIDEVKKHQEFFTEIFKMVKMVMNLKRDKASQNPKMAQEFQLREGEIRGALTIVKLDSQGIPLEMLVESKDQYRVQIFTESYKLLNSDTFRH